MQILKIINLMGPTASGKTSLALMLAKHLPIEIINVDSAQIYQGMDIGTGKPSYDERAEIPHHLMDMLDPKTAYSAAEFQKDAIALITDILKRNKIPLLVGGTMLYFKALQEGLSLLPACDSAVRMRLAKEGEAMGWEVLYQKLLEKDPLCAKRISPSDPQRLSRALEVLEVTGKPMSFWLAQPKPSLSNYRFINIGLIPIQTSRSQLHERIEKRFDMMLEQGLIAEVEKLFARIELSLSLPSIRAVGYRQIWYYLLKHITYEEMREKAIAATRQLAKRQLTWLKSWPNLMAFDFLDPQLFEKVNEVFSAQQVAENP